MSKIYKGYELIKAIADGEIKEDTKFREMEENRYYIVKDRKIWEQEDTGIYNSKLESLQITYGVFELIEDKTIDIDNIEELNDTCYDEENMISEEKEYYHNLTREQQNTILRAVKQLDKRVKELEELNIEINEKDINEAISKAREQRNKEIKSIKEK